MRFYVWVLLLLVLPSACGGQSNSSDVQKASCELLSAAERDEIKRHVDEAIADSESLATWLAWWNKYESRSFPYSVTQNGYYEWTGSAWTITGTTFDTLVYRFEDGSVIEEHGDFLNGRAMLSFPDGTVASSAQSNGMPDPADQSSSFSYADWTTRSKSFNQVRSGSELEASAPFGTLATHIERGDTMVVNDSLELSFSGLTISLLYAQQDDPDTRQPVATVRLWRNGNPYTYEGPADACNPFRNQMLMLYPDIDEVFQTQRLRNGNP